MAGPRAYFGHLLNLLANAAFRRSSRAPSGPRCSPTTHLPSLASDPSRRPCRMTLRCFLTCRDPGLRRSFSRCRASGPLSSQRDPCLCLSVTDAILCAMYVHALPVQIRQQALVCADGDLTNSLASRPSKGPPCPSVIDVRTFSGPCKKSQIEHCAT